MAVTSSNIPSAEKVPATKSTLWQEEMRGKDQADGGSGISQAQSPVQGQAGAASSLKDSVLDSKEGEGWGWCDAAVTWFEQLSWLKTTIEREVSCEFGSWSIPARRRRQTSTLLCRDRTKALWAGVQEGKSRHHMLENHSVEPSPAPAGRWGCLPSKVMLPSGWGQNEGENAFSSPSTSQPGPGCWGCQTLCAASSSRALFAFGLPNESLEGTKAFILFSLEQ